MEQRLFPNSKHWIIYRYVQSLDSGDLDTIEQILEVSQNDLELDQLISEINREYASELGLTPLSQTSAKVQQLLNRYFSQEDSEDEKPLTVGDVAAKMSSDPELPKAHREIGKSLINNPTILPERLSLEVVRKIGVKLHLLDESFLRFFRDTALQMMMGRGQAHMAATREKRSRRADPKPNVKNKRNDNE